MTRQQQRGLGIVSAIFLLVALTALGAYMLTLGGVTQATVDRAVLTARVYSAARSGLEWGIHRAVAPATQPGACASTATAFSPTGSGLFAINVSVECSQSSHSSGAKVYYVYYLRSTAAYDQAATLDYIERKIEATVCRSTETTSEQC